MNSEEKARTFNMDGYYNMLNKYGTRQDNQTAYDYLSDPFVDDMTLVKMYEGNGLFSTIIDRPAEEATKHGLDIDFGKEEVSNYIYERMDDIGFEEQFTTAIKWSRLYGGAIGVLIINDGKGLEEPLDKKNVTSIEEIRVFERPLVQPDYQTMYSPANGIRPHTAYREPEYFDVFSIYGTFRVHRSRCLVFRNGRLPEQATNENYRYWGIPEYIRVRDAIRECITSHHYGVQLLEKSSQAVYSMKNLANYLSTDAGENQIIKRLQIIDMARSMMNTIAIDADGEKYDFKTMTMAGAKDLIDTTCNMLSAVTHIPQTILFGRSPAGENATGESDMENYYNMVENIQKQNMKRNSRLVIDLIIKQGIHDGDIEKAPKYKVSFAKLWSMSDSEQASVEQTKAQTELTKAQAVQIYSDLQAVDPTEIRDSISDNEDLGISVDKSADSHKKNLESIDIDPDDLDLGAAIDIQDEPEEKEEVSNNQNPEKDNHHAEEKEIAEGVDHEEDIKPTDSEMVIGEETEDAPDTVPSESEVVIAKEMNNDAAEGDWVTINGTHVLIGKGGKAESGGNLVGKDFSSAKSEKHEAKGKSGGGSNSAVKPNNTQPSKYETSASESKSISLQKPYSTGYSDTWTDPDDPSYTVDLTESKDIWLEGNKDQLVKNWKERRAQGIKEKPKDFENHEYTAWQLSKISGHEKELPLDDAMDKMNDAMPANVFHGWFTEANSEYKPRVVEAVTKSPEARSAALSIMFENYKYFHPNTKMTFNEFLNSPMTMYRGGHGQSHTEDDVFSSYTWDKSVAEKFAGKGGKVYEAHIRPIDTYGSVNDAGESEIMVPSVIAPNGNKDSRTDADTDNGVGIIVVKDGKFLVGTRQDGFGICSAGGHIKDGETPQEAAKREAYEEFGIVPLTLIPIGETKASSGLYCNSTVFLCDSYSGKIETDEEEMTSPRFMTMDELSGVRLYEPFEESLALMLDVLFRESKRTDTSDADWITVNGVHIPIGKNGKAIGGPLKGKDFSDSKSKSGEESESSNSLTTNSKTAKIKNVIKTPIDQISPTGKNILKHRGFKSEQHLNNHWQNGRTHRAEYEAEGLDKSGYEKRAVELAESKADGVKIRGYRTRDGYICRYDVEKNDYVKADIDKGIRTMFKPDNGVQYYEDLKHAEGGDDNGN